ncbi:MAG: hypothetical protein KIT15_02465 [Xanthobacteraceae bacterium]|nr:hypothetical protein [Xanthobacteraceae bacterium]MBX3522328.1 hypothetical protein [Xanthobacteraceae bacterium]MBX3550087.1 hypothetical protein [Xanthobacteraceae bacterium]MCW5673418.1 hypothetical protein [Xanthobacteraceae bacterium]MCW5679079.1 hypothetical protein [Xanthobacteraceae bacterium]
MQSLKAISTVAALVISSAAFAHAPEKGKHGGQQVNAGNYHVEAVVKGNTIDLFFTDHGETPVPTKGFKATAILVVNGKPVRISLAPRGENRITGTSPVELAVPIRGAVQITNGDGETVQAKF